MKTQTVAAIDIGSNSLKLAIVEAAASDSFTVVLQDRERVRLGEETLKTHCLSAQAISKAAEAIDKFRSIAESRRADSILAVATASVREAQNASEFVAQIEKLTGVKVEVLSSLEEARLIGIAAAQHCRLNKGSLMNIDIGGGSTELSLMRDGEPYKLFSMRLGAVGLTERFILSDPPKKRELENLRAEITLALDRPLRKIKNEIWQHSTGTSGTILNIAALLNFQNNDEIERKPVIELEKLIDLNEMMARISVEERAGLPVISPQRAEVIVAGGLILENAMRALGIETLEPCLYALREGVIIDYLREIEAESLPPVPDVLDKRLRSVFAVGRRFGYEENHALQVAKLAEKIFDALASKFELKRHWRTMLSAAAILHDIGYHISHESHHKHSLYLIKHSEITGFSEIEKLIIANIARYHRASQPKEKHPDFGGLRESDREAVWKMGAILRLAEGLDHSYENRVEDLEFNLDRGTVEMRVVGENCDAELRAVEKKKEMFEAAFERALVVSANAPASKKLDQPVKLF